MKIKIKNLKFLAIIGLLPAERKKAQAVTADAEISYGYNRDEKNFIDYVEVVKIIEETIKHGEFELLEDACNACLKELQRYFPAITTAKLTLCKPDILPNCEVSVEHYI